MMMKDDDNDDGENGAARRSYSWPASSLLKVQTELHTSDYISSDWTTYWTTKLASLAESIWLAL